MQNKETTYRNWSGCANSALMLYEISETTKKCVHTHKKAHLKPDSAIIYDLP